MADYKLLSDYGSASVDKCPSCGGGEIRGPHDTDRSATFLFTRAYFCRTCWWDKEVRMKDDIAEAKAKQEKAKAKADAEKALKYGRR